MNDIDKSHRHIQASSSATRKDIEHAIRIFLGRMASDNALETFTGKPLDAFLLGILRGKEFQQIAEDYARNPGELRHTKRLIAVSSSDIIWLEELASRGGGLRLRAGAPRNWPAILAELCSSSSDADVQAAGRLFSSHTDVNQAQEDEKSNEPPSDNIIADIYSNNKYSLIDYKNIIDQYNSSITYILSILDTNEDEAINEINNNVRDINSFFIAYADQIKFSYYLLSNRRCLAHYHLEEARFYSRNRMLDRAYRVCREIYDSNLFDSLPEREIIKFFELFGLSAMRRGEIDEAIQIYRKLQRRFPQHADTYFFIAEIEANANPTRALVNFTTYVTLASPPVLNRALAAAEFFATHGDIARAVETVVRAAPQAKPYERHLFFANLAKRRGDEERWTSSMTDFFEEQGLSAADIQIAEPNSLFGFGRCDSRPRSNGEWPKVSIITTCFNAEATIAHSLQSILDQTVENFELLVVDDCSSDRSAEIVNDFAKQDARIRYIRSPQNCGTYACKNIAIEMATGEFVTFHDADDWMHPQRLEVHLKETGNGHAASFSKWVRMDADGLSLIQRGGGYIHVNPASTLIRKSVISDIGAFDTVRTGADTELLFRMRHAYGNSAVIDLPQVLALGFHHGNSLTQAGAAAFDEFRYSPVRNAYWQSWAEWQFKTLVSGDIPRMRHKPGGERDFAAPAEIL